MRYFHLYPLLEHWSINKGRNVVVFSVSLFYRTRYPWLKWCNKRKNSLGQSKLHSWVYDNFERIRIWSPRVCLICIDLPNWLLKLAFCCHHHSRTVSTHVSWRVEHLVVEFSADNRTCDVPMTISGAGSDYCNERMLFKFVITFATI